MPIPENICTNEGVYYKAGGEANLAQLIDKDGDGRVDPGILLAAQTNATTEVLGHVEVQSLITIEAPYPRLWVLCAEWLAIRNCWMSGTQGQAFPEKFAEEVKNVRENLLPRILSGNMGNVAERGTTAAQVLKLVDHNSAFTLERTKGLW